jgi:hypothetical protein
MDGTRGRLAPNLKNNPGKTPRALLDDYQNRWLTGGAVRKSNKTKGEK